jgi:hypothetical protein
MTKITTTVKTEVTVEIQLDEEQAKVLYELVQVPVAEVKKLMSSRPNPLSEYGQTTLSALFTELRSGLRTQLDYISQGHENGDWS